jgi:hypothetical protein
MGPKRAAKSARRKRETPASGDIHGIQGEGNREADRRYREGARRFAESGRVDDAARDARASVDRNEERERNDDEGAL